MQDPPFCVQQTPAAQAIPLQQSEAVPQASPRSLQVHLLAVQAPEQHSLALVQPWALLVQQVLQG